MQLLCNCLRICSVSSRCSASYFREFVTLYLIFYQISSHFVVPLVVMGGWPSPNCICGLLPNPSPCRPTAPRWLSGWPYTSPQPRNGLGAMGDFFQSLSLQILDVSLIKPPISIYNLSPLRRHPLGRCHMNVDDRGIHVMAKLVLFQQHISRDL